MVKRILYMVLESRTPRDETIRSSLMEVDNLVNSRPLCSSSEVIHTSSALTPNMLLRCSSREVEILPRQFGCRRQWRISQAINYIELVDLDFNQIEIKYDK